MKRLAALGVLVWIAAWWLGRDRAAAPPSEAVATAASPVPATRAPRGPALAPAAPTERPEPTEAVRGQVDEILPQLRRAARGCLAGHTPRPHPPGEPDETMDRVTVRVAIAFTGGAASATRVAKLADGFADDTLERCVLDSLAAARWPSAQPAGALDLAHTLYVGELVGRDPLDSPRAGPPLPPPPPLPGVPTPTALPPLITGDPSAAGRTPSPWPGTSAEAS